MRSFWKNLYENEICGVNAPTENTSVNGYGYHVVAGGKETCSGDYGSPLLCDINGDITLIGVNSRGYDECGAEGYPAIHVSLNSISDWIDEIIKNESGIIWTEWSKCDADCKQTRKRSRYESEVRDCKGVCFKPVADAVDDLRLCSLEENRIKRDIQHENRILGGQNISQGSISYVAKLQFHLEDGVNANQLCAGTVVNKHFIASTKFCCETGTFVKINFDGDPNSIESSTFYLHGSMEPETDQNALFSREYRY